MGSDAAKDEIVAPAAGVDHSQLGKEREEREPSLAYRGL